MNLTIRNETPADYRAVEELTRKAFWNLHVPGCNEHFLVHKLRSHQDFVSSLDFVAVKDSRVIAHIMYAESSLKNDTGESLRTLTFGPVSVLPEYQRQGIGSMLITHSMKEAVKLGYGAVIIYGSPANYCKFGFKGSKTYNIRTPEGKYPCCLLVRELKSGILTHHEWWFFESDVYNLDSSECEVFDSSFEPLKKEYRYTQEEFSILSQAYFENESCG